MGLPCCTREGSPLSIGLTLSGDGASHNNIQFSSRHITAIPVDTSCHPKDLFMGIRPELNHTTATQMEGWKDTVFDFCAGFNGHPDSEQEVDPERVWRLARGYLGDHASDQKKLSTALETHHQECDRVVRGEAISLSDDPQDEAEWNQLLGEKLGEMVDEAGGDELWGSLPAAERLRQEKEMIRRVKIELGE